MIVDFLIGSEPDIEGRYFNDILTMSDYDLEYCHDYIQWMFPLKDVSKFNPNACILTDEDIVLIKSNPIAIANFKAGIHRLVGFYEKYEYWALDQNHNILRITRIIKSTSLLLSPAHAEKVYQRILKRCTRVNFFPNELTIKYWICAISGKDIPDDMKEQNVNWK